MARIKRVNPTCIFCDNAADSGEHLWSDWMGDLLKRKWHRSRLEIVKDFRFEGAPFGELSYWSCHGATHKKKVYVVCATCNNGWMNDLEKAARAYLEQMIKGELITLDQTAQRAVAEWISLKVLVLEHDPTGGQPPTPIFSREDRLNFKDTHRPPSGFRAWLCKANGEDSSRWYDSLTLGAARMLLSPTALFAGNLPPAGPSRNVQAVTWGIRHLLIHSFSITYPYLNPLLQMRFEGGVNVWPPTNRTIRWPTDDVFADGEIDMLANSLEAYSMTLPRRSGS